MTLLIRSALRGGAPKVADRLAGAVDPKPKLVGRDRGSIAGRGVYAGLALNYPHDQRGEGSFGDYFQGDEIADL